MKMSSFLGIGLAVLASIALSSGAAHAADLATLTQTALSPEAGGIATTLAVAGLGVSASQALKSDDAAAADVAVTENRVTLASIEAKIVAKQFITSDDINAVAPVDAPMPGVLTICVLTLANGFTVTGESACADPANFNAELGRQIAYDNAVRKVWPLEGYALRDRLNTA